MHPTMISALAHEVERERRGERPKLHRRRQGLAAPGHGSHRERSARATRRRLIAGISLWPRVS
jgi:hypothetical protein